MKGKVPPKTYRVNSHQKQYIEYLVKCSESKLHQVLLKYQEWPFDKNEDINAWADVLERFHDIYQQVITKYTPSTFTGYVEQQQQQQQQQHQRTSPYSAVNAPAAGVAAVSGPSYSFTPVLLRGDSIPIEEYEYDKFLVVNALRFTRALLTNCTNSHLYPSSVLIVQFLSFNDLDFPIEAFKLLNLLVSKAKFVREHQSLVFYHIYPRATIFTQGFPENHLDLLSCSKDDSNNLIAKRHLSDEDLLHIYYRINLAKIFSSAPLRRKWMQLRIHAVNILYVPIDGQFVQPTFLTEEPEFFNELMELAKWSKDVDEDVLVAAFNTLSTLTMSYPTNSLTVSLHTAFGQGFIQSIVRNCVATIMGVVPAERPYTEMFVRAVFQFIFSISSSNKGLLHSSGIFQSLLPLVRFHSDILAEVNFQVVSYKIIQTMMLYKSSNVELFDEMEYLADFFTSIADEISYVIDHPQVADPQEDLVVESNRLVLQSAKQSSANNDKKSLSTSGVGANKRALSKSASAIDNKNKQKQQQQQIKDEDLPIDPRLFEVNFPPKVHLRKLVLLYEMLHCLLPMVSSSGVPRSILNQILDSSVPTSLKRIFENHQSFSAATITQAVLLPTHLIQNEPTCFTALQNAGLVKTLFDYISGTNDLPEVVYVVPSTLNSFCLNPSFKTMLVESQFVPRLISTFSSPKWAPALNPRLINSVAVQLHELIRHHPELRPSTIDACIKLLDDVLALEDIPADRTVNLAIYNMVIKFLAALFSNGDNDRLFIAQNGLDKLLAIYTSGHFPIRNLIIFKVLSINNTSAVLKTIIKQLNQQFEELDSISAWRKTRIIRPWNNDEVKNREQILRGIRVLGSLIQILTSLIRDHPDDIPATVLHEWATPAGVAAFGSLSCLQRSIYWEQCVGAKGSLLFITPSKKTKESSPKSTQVAVPAVVAPVVPAVVDPVQPVVDVVPQEEVAVASGSGGEQEIPPITSAPSEQSPPTATTTTGNEEFIFGAHINDLEFLSRYFVDSLNPNHKREVVSVDPKSEILIKALAKNLYDWVQWNPEECDTSKEAYIKFFGEISEEIANLMFPQLISELFDLGFFTKSYETINQLLSSYNPDEKANSPLALTIESCGDLISVPITILTPKTLSLQDKVLTEKILPSLFAEVAKFWNLADLPRYSFKKVVLDSVYFVLNRLDEVPEVVAAKRPARVSQSAVQAEATITLLTEMGFPRAHVEKGIKALGTNNPESITDWMINHPYVEEEIKPVTETSPPTPPQEKITIESIAAELRPTLVDKALKLFSVLNDDHSLLESIYRLLNLLATSKSNPDMKETIVNRLMKDVEISFSDIQNNSHYLMGIFFIMQKLNDIPDIHEMLINKGFLMISLGYLTDILNNKSIIFNHDLQSSNSEENNQRLLNLNNLLQLTHNMIKHVYTKPANFDLEEEEKKPEEILDESIHLLEMCIELLGAPPTIIDLTVLKLLKELTKQHALALHFIEQNGISILLAKTCSMHIHKDAVTLANTIVRQLLEDRSTLLASTHTLIKNTMGAGSKNAKGLSVKTYLTTLAKYVHHSPLVFLRATADTCRLNQSNGVYLAKTLPPPPTTDSDLPHFTQVAHHLISSLLAKEPIVAPAPQAPTTTTTTTTNTITVGSKKPLRQSQKSTLPPKTLAATEAEEKKVKLLFPRANTLKLLEELNLFSKFQTIVLDYTPVDVIDYVIENFVMCTIESVMMPTHQSACRFIISLCGRAEGRQRVITSITKHLVSSKTEYAETRDKSAQMRVILILNLVALTLNLPAHCYSVDIYKMMVDHDMINLLLEVLDSVDMSSNKATIMVISMLQTIGHLTKFASNPPDREKIDEVFRANIFEFPLVNFDNFFRNSYDSLHTLSSFAPQQHQELSQHHFIPEEYFTAMMDNQRVYQDEGLNPRQLLDEFRLIADGDDDEDDEDDFNLLDEILNNSQLANIANSLNPNNFGPFTLPRRPATILNGGGGGGVNNIGSSFLGGPPRGEPDEASVYALSFEPDLIKILTKVTKEEEAALKIKEKEARAKEKENKLKEAKASPTVTSPTSVDPSLTTSASQTPTLPAPHSPQLSSPSSSSLSSSSSSVQSSLPSSVTQSPQIATPDIEPPQQAQEIVDQEVEAVPQQAQEIVAPEVPVIAPVIDPVIAPQVELAEPIVAPVDEPVDEPVVPVEVAPTDATEPVAPGTFNFSAQSTETTNSEDQGSSSSSTVQETTTTTTPAVPPQQPTAVDLGIDPAFLSALPPDLRAEVIAAQLGTIHQTQASSQITINPEFLAALPIDIQNEVIEQERIISSRRRNIPPPADLSHAEDMDNASFLATLPPDLRDEVLMSQPEAFLTTLPPELHAEAVRLRERDRYDFSRVGGGLDRNPIPLRATAAKSAARAKNFVQNQSGSLIRKENLIPLLKILYLDQSWNRQLLYGILQQICSYTDNRNQLLTYLFQILTASNSAEVKKRTFASGDFSPIDNPYHRTMKFKQFQTIEESNHPPLLVIRRVLEILQHLLANNPNTVSWVCTDQPFPMAPTKNGKERADATENLLPLWKLCSIITNKEIFNKSIHLEKLVSIFLVILDQSKSTPLFAQQYINNFVKVMLNSSCSDTKITQLLVKIGQSEENRTLVLEELTLHAKTLVGEVIQNLQNLKNMFKEMKIPPSLIVSLLPTSTKENNLLQILQTMSLILTPKPVAPTPAIASPFAPRGLASPPVAPPVVVAEPVVATTPAQPTSMETLMTKKKSSSVPMSLLLLPLVETYFLLNSPPADKLTISTVPSSPSLTGLRLSSQGLQSTPPTSDYQTTRFFEFVEQNKHLINELIRQDNSLLSDSFAILIKVPKFLDFDNKRNYFRQYFQSKKERANTIRLRIRRNHIFEDSYMQLRMRPADEFKGKLHIQFSGEEGIDVGGLLREWYLVLSREMFNPNYALFKASAGDNVTFQPNPESYINPDHLSYFKFIGRIIGKALYDGQMLDAFFTRSFYKHMLGLPITVTDMEAIDNQYHKNLIWILNNDITNILDLTFSTEIDIFDSMKVIELKPDGVNIPVTEENKMEYVRLVANVRMTNSIKDQIASFLEGFHELIPKSLISIFNELELELLISGLPEIDIDDLKANTEYTGYTAESLQINWLWNVVANFTNEEKALLLQFVTGTSKVPLEGFKALVGYLLLILGM
eukprot:gene8997-10553_t